MAGCRADRRHLEPGKRQHLGRCPLLDRDLRAGLDREINALPDKKFFIDALMLCRFFFRIHKLPNFRSLFIQLGQMLGPQPLVNL